MDTYIYRGREYDNGVDYALDILGGKWKIPILWYLSERTLRFTELRRSLGKVTDKMLTQQLRDLEEDGFVTRTVYPVVPPKVEYTITPKGEAVLPIIRQICDWAKRSYDPEAAQDDRPRHPAAHR